ncbi:hypothetical protein [Conexibacter arvalis]|uniref:Uncharacterized protein n=1 Tax=Conexibacter arvalis TaxID=912552 RepID=A0A840IAY0_9ACTN|nr:hypothetical protein [Conexibacter arvalis]MBB4661986.1 hypothetical protein [Conexibacter arvalis]
MFAAIDEPAGGAAIGEVILASSAALTLTVALLVLGLGHRAGRVKLLGRVSDFAERRTGLPGWVGFPAAIAAGSLLCAVVGMYWDIALHIDVGRDEGPLANPAHYFILIGLFGIFTAGFVAMVLPFGKPSRSAVRLGVEWYAPLGGLLVCSSAAFALLGFPLDDVWHRLFGQDVTLWGPTHLMLIGGASMTVLGLAVLLVEGQRAKEAAADGAGGPGASAPAGTGGTRAASGRRGAVDEPGWVGLTRRVALCGAFLLGLSTFQAEFDFGVPQFRFVFQPLLIMLAAGVGLVAVRVWAGRGAAIGAVLFFLLIRGLLALLVGPVIGETTPHFPLYVVPALIVEAIALKPGIVRRPFRFGLLTGIGIGTLGLAAEWGWTHLWMPIPWPSTLLPEAIVFGLPTALGAAFVGAWIGDRLALGAKDHDRRLDVAALAGSLAIFALIGVALYKPAVEDVRATVTLADVQGPPNREVEAVVRFDPVDAAEGSEWLTATAWQGDGFVVDRLERVADGVYRTTQPIPVHGNWKALVRMQRGNTLSGIPIFMPKDRAIPAPEVPAPASFTRTFEADHRILQREQKAAAGWLWAVAYTVVGLIALSLLALMAWALRRLSTAAEGTPPSTPSARATAAPTPSPPLSGAASGAGA